MTAWRVGLAIKPESEFGVEDTSQTWHYVGVGMDFNFTESNGWKFQNGLGSKVPELIYEGRFSGMWSANMYLDYNNFYWLQFGLEDYAFTKTNYSTEESTAGRDIGIHIFSTSNTKALKSFSLRILKLNDEVGGPFDENTVLLGCTMNKVAPSYEGSSTSAVKVSIGGTFVNTVLKAVNIEDTVTSDVLASKNKVTPINWGCLQIMNATGDSWEKIANNERTGFTFSRSISTVPDCGERIDTAFYESAVQPISITALVYSRNPNQWQTRMHTGGIRNDISVGSSSSPRSKGLQTIPNIRIASGTANASGRTPDYLCYAEFEDVAVDSWGNSYNSGSEITESPTLKARVGRIVFRTPDITESLSETSNIAVKLTYNFNNDVSNLETYIPSGTTVTLPSYNGTKSGSTFSGWQIGTAQYKVGDFVKITDSTIVTAVWS